MQMLFEEIHIVDAEQIHPLLTPAYLEQLMIMLCSKEDMDPTNVILLKTEVAHDECLFI